MSDPNPPPVRRVPGPAPDPSTTERHPVGHPRPMIALRPGVYLEDYPPARSQWRARPLDRIKPLIVVHTAEGGYGPSLQWIKDRDTAGSYHMLGFPFEISTVVDLRHAAYHAIGVNTTSIGISGSIHAADWATMRPRERADWVDVYAHMAAIAARWLAGRGNPMPDPRRLTRAQAKAADANGFIDHARIDPNRRTDPGAAFPWGQFFDRYAELTNQTTDPKGPTMPTVRNEHVAQVQERLGETADGIYGPKTAAAVKTWIENGGLDDTVTEDAYMTRKDAIADAAIDLHRRITRHQELRS